MSEYVLPTFEVQIESNDDFIVEDEKIRAIIRAKYMHGKALRGTAIVSINEESYGYYPYRSESESNEPEVPLAKKTIVLDGHETIEFDIKNDLKFDRKASEEFYRVSSFVIKAEVTETLTGLSQSATKTINIHRDTYDITTDRSNVGLKRGSTINLTVCFTPCTIVFNAFA